MFKKAAEINAKKYVSSYRDNYRLICKTILDKKCRMIVMEHPMRNINILKKLLEGIDNVIFVSNELNFKNVLKSEPYYIYFKDIYAGDFGHCTEKGNMLIAENLIPFILKEIK